MLYDINTIKWIKIDLDFNVTSEPLKYCRLFSNEDRNCLEFKKSFCILNLTLNLWFECKLSLSLLVKVPAVVQESLVFGPVEAAIQSCFNRVYSTYTHRHTNPDKPWSSVCFWLYLGYRWEGRGGAFFELAAIGASFAAVALRPLQTLSQRGCTAQSALPCLQGPPHHRPSVSLSVSV